MLPAAPAVVTAMPIILLILQLALPGQEPTHFQSEMADLDECFRTARLYLDTFAKEAANGQAAAGCAVVLIETSEAKPI